MYIHTHWIQAIFKKKKTMTVSVGNFSFVSAKNSVYIVSSVYWTPGRHRETPNWAPGNYKERKEHHSLLWRAYSLMGRLRWQMEKEMATHSTVLACRIPGTGEPGGLPSMGSHRVGHDWSDLARWQIPFPRVARHHRWQQVCLQLTFPGGRCMLLLWKG